MRIQLQPEVRELSANSVVARTQIAFEIDDPIGADRVGNASNANVTVFLALDLILHVSVGLKGDNHLTWRRLMLQPRGKIHGTPDHGVVHPVCAAEIAHGAIIGVYANSTAERRLDSGVAP